VSCYEILNIIIEFGLPNLRVLTNMLRSVYIARDRNILTRHPQLMTLSPSLTVFRLRFKTELFTRSYDLD